MFDNQYSPIYKLETTVAKKIEKRPFDIYTDKLNRAFKHGWRLTKVVKVDGHNYHEMLRVYKSAGFENRFFKIGISAVTGKMITLQTGD